jgi:hypothetical protein
MGERPAGRSLDRINNDGDYTPQNCRWATHSEQIRNSRRATQITWNGATKTLSEWSEVLGMKYDMLKRRRLLGWSTERMLTEPSRYA